LSTAFSAFCLHRDQSSLNTPLIGCTPTAHTAQVGGGVSALILAGYLGHEREGVGFGRPGYFVTTKLGIWLGKSRKTKRISRVAADRALMRDAQAESEAGVARRFESRLYCDGVTPRSLRKWRLKLEILP
jgi:hypothetical protein